MLHYILQTIAFQLFFLIVYDLFLKKETFFNWNRVYLLITSALSLALPFIKIDRFSQVIPQEYIVNLPQVVIGSLSEQKIDAMNLTNVTMQDTSIWSWELLLYLGMVVAFMILLVKMIKLAVMIQRNPKSWKDNLLIVKLLNSTRAFSFFHYIFLGERIAASDRVSILKHEQVHVEQRHTLDLLFFEALRIVFWFNPLIYMYQNRMAELHEFIADARAVKHQDRSAYYENLLSQVFETQNLSFINPFFKKSLIKKRIVMLSKHPSKQTQLLKYALLIPMVFGMLMYTSASAQEINVSKLVDQEMYNELKLELQKMQDQDATPSEVIHAFSPFIESLEPNKEEFYRAFVYREYSVKEFVENMKKKGLSEEKLSEMKIKLAPKHNYKEYLQFLKTDEGLKKWELSPTSGVIRQVVSDINNLTEAESERLIEGKSFVDQEKFIDFYKLILTDGKSTKVFENTKKSKRIAKGSPDISSGELEVPFAIIEQPPMYPGCETDDNKQQKDCLSREISKHVQKNFNIELARSLKLVGRQKINVVFKIDKNGYITGIRSRAPHPALETEVIRVISSLPRMMPGMHKGKPVIVPYSLPIIFQVKGDGSAALTPLIEKLIAMRKQIEVQGHTNDKEQKGFDLLLEVVTGTKFNPELVKETQRYTSLKERTLLMEKISDVFEQVQIQGNISKKEEEALKGFLILVTEDGLSNPALEEGIDSVEIPFGVVEQVPVFPGCNGKTNLENKECTVIAITEHIHANFNKKLASSLGLEGSARISAVFKINAEGNIEDIRTRAPHPELEKEAVRVISNFPQMQPGMQQGKAVTVLYSLPIIFTVKE